MTRLEESRGHRERITKSLERPGIRNVVSAGCLLLPLIVACGGSGAPAGDAREPAPPGRQSDVSGATPVGRIDATLAGEARTWNVLHLQREDGLKSTGIYRSRSLGRNTAHSIIMGGHEGTSIAPRRSLHVSIHTTQSLDRCPCTLDGQLLEYWGQRSAERYEGKSVVTLDRFEANADGTYRATGSFTGTLPPITDVGRNPNPTDSVSVKGTFDIARIVVSGAGR